MSKYTEKLQKAAETDFSNRPYLNAFEGAGYTGLSLTVFKSFAERIGAVRHVGRRCIYVREIIDAALQHDQAGQQAQDCFLKN